MSELDKAVTVKRGLSLDNKVGIFPFEGDPRILGFDAPEGSKILDSTVGRWYRKIGPATTDWRLAGGGNLLALTAGRSNNTTNTYLNGPSGVPTDQVGFVVPVDASIVAISTVTRTAQTWVGEVHKNLAIIPGAFLSVTAVRNDFVVFLPGIAVSAGDELQFYGNGNSIDRPSMTVWLEGI